MGCYPEYGRNNRTWAKVLSRHLTEGDMRMISQQTHEKVFVIISYPGNANSNHADYHSVFSAVTTIKKTVKTACRQARGTAGFLIHCWWECELAQPLCRIVQQFLKKLKIHLSCDPILSLLQIYSQEK